MKKLLYITASPKPEPDSVSKQAGRAFVDRFLSENPDYTLEELDLASASLPEPNQHCFTGRCSLVGGPALDALGEADRAVVRRMNELCTQFLSADVYVIASPMWSLSFPFWLKQYIDCIMLNGRMLRITTTGVCGLLDDKPRKMVYIQSSGGVYPKILYGQLNVGVKYIHDLFRYLGIREFHKVLIQGTDMANVGKDKAISAASEDFECALKSVSRPHSRVAVSI